jgi:hypothetical protein
MQPEMNQANQELAAIYNPAIQGIQSQAPAVQNLYQTLMTGLAAQTAQQNQALAQSAQARGVAGGMINQNVSGMLNEALALEQARLGAQRASDVAGIQGQVAQAGVQRAQAAGQLAGTINTQNIEARQNQYKMADIERTAQMEQLQNQRSFEIQRAQYERAQAEASRARAEQAASQAAEMDIEDFLSRTDASFTQLAGGDGKVSPKTFQEGLQLWRSKGLPEAEYYNRYNGYINRSHIKDYLPQANERILYKAPSNLSQLRF